MQLNPKIRNFKLKKLEKIEVDSGPQIPQKERIDNITQIVTTVLEKLNDSDQLFRTERNLTRKSFRDAVLIITNKGGTSGSHYQEEFTNRMDPRDKVINVPFHFSIPTHRDNTPEGADFASSELFAAVSAHIEDYLVRMLEVVVSVSFNELMEGKLKENECKDYASKNILLNVHAVCRESFRCLKERGLIDGREKEFELVLTELADNTLTNAVRSLAPYYPQAPPSGGTPRIRQALLAIDRNHNSELDFLSTQKLTLERSADGDYTEYIMRVINRAILVTGEIDDDSGQRTQFEKFKDFMENLIWLAKDESCIKAMSTIMDLNNKKVGTMKDLSPLKRQESYKQDVSFPKRKILINKFFRQATIANAIEAVHIEGEKDPQITEESRERQLNSMKLNHEVEMGQKLPSGLETFGNNDLKDRNFTAKHSSVLRVITKWAENLEAVFENAEKFVLNRNYPFTTLAGRSVYPTTELKKQIFNQITVLKEKKNKIHDQLIAKNKLFQAEFLTKKVGNAQSTARFIKRYTDTRIVASKMNTLIIKFMQEYLSALINLLIEAGKFEQQNDQFSKGETEYINLISFRIGDLMRARMHVNEAACIRLLHTLYLLDEHQNKEAPFFKLVRVKNKLDKQDNNVLINFLFRGKLQCELQLSSQKIEGKEQKYYAFSHFLYELSRGSFGILSECAIIISQHDPIVSSHNLSDLKILERKKVTTPQDLISSENDNNIFICGKCSRLIMNESKQIFLKKGGTENICNQCFIKNFKKDFKVLQLEEKNTENINSNLIQKHLSNPDLSQWMTQMIENMQVRRLTHYAELSDIKQTCLLFSINQKYNKIDYNLLIYEEIDTDWHIIHINDAVLLSSNDISDEDFEIKKLTSMIKEQMALKSLTYIETSLNRINMADIIKANKKMTSSINFVNKLCQIEDSVRSIIARSNIEAILQNKNQTIDFNKNALKMEVMSELAEATNSINHIEYVFAESLELKAIPAWISKADKLKLINLKNNKIKDVHLIQGKSQLKELYLSGNQITEINCNNLRNIQKLDLSSNQLSQFASQELPCLLELNLSQNQIKLIDINFPILKTLNLSRNGLTQLDAIRLPSTLQRLILSQNKLKQLPTLPPNLKQLTFNYNQIAHLDHLKLPKSLVILNACSNNLVSLKIEDMPTLVTVYVSENANLIQVSMKNIPKLKQISIQNTKVESIENIEFPEEMQWLFLDCNCIKQVRLKNMKSIEILSLTGNQLKCLELKDTNVNMLTLFQNKITSLDNFTIPKSVQQLFLKDNALTSVSLKDYPSLQIINLQANQLSSIDIDGMPLLRQLALDNNCFDNADSIRLPPSLEKLFLRSNKLTHLNLSDLPELIYCILDNNPLTSISLQNMPKLQEVGLINSSIKSQADVDIPSTVKKIFLHNNQMEDMSYSNMPNLTMVMNSCSLLKSAKFENLKNLDSIYLNNNQITQLYLKKIPKLEKLVVSTNNLSELALVDMPFLKTVTVNLNKLTQIKLESVALIQTLNVSGNQLKQLKLKNMPMLTSIEADNNQIEVCQLQNMPSLKSIRLDQNKLRTFQLTRLKSLTLLSLKDCPIESIHLSQLKNLQKIEMEGVKMKNWRVQGLPKLKQLSITNGEVENLQFVDMVSLEILYLNDNKLIEANFNQLPNLQSLSIDNNYFVQLTFINLKEIKTININKNKLKSLQFSSLPNLTSIYLQNNMIETLTLKEVAALESIGLSSNQLKSIDTSACKALTTLNISSNPVESLTSLNIYKPSITNLAICETQLETLSIKDYEQLDSFTVNGCKKLKQMTVENCQKLSYLQFKQNPVLKAVSIKEMPLLSLVCMENTTPDKCEIINVNEEINIYVSTDEMQTLLKSQNPLQQINISLNSQ